jgi:hypothetical protein
MSKWLAENKVMALFSITFLAFAAIGGWAYLYQTLPGGVWHRNRITGATCYKTVYCWASTKDPFGKGLKLPNEPFEKGQE